MRARSTKPPWQREQPRQEQQQQEQQQQQQQQQQQLVPSSPCQVSSPSSPWCLLVSVASRRCALVGGVMRDV
jgi:hypothetical protein